MGFEARARSDKNRSSLWAVLGRCSASFFLVLVLGFRFLGSVGWCSFSGLRFGVRGLMLYHMAHICTRP